MRLNSGADVAAGAIVVAGVIAFMVFISFLLSWPVMMLWNGCLVGAVNGVNPITWLQAWGLLVLCSFLFKSTSVSKS